MCENIVYFSANDVVKKIRLKFPELEIVITRNDNMSFAPENDSGYIEYKRELINKSDDKLKKLATQMYYRITEGVALNKKSAIYIVGVDDNGTIYGLNENSLYESVISIDKMCNYQESFIKRIIIVNIEEKIIMKVIISTNSNTNPFF